MARILRLAFIAILALAFGMSWADQSLIKLTTSPTVSVADGKSTVTVTAEVRDSSGHLAANGTSVLFTTTLGVFRSEVVPTVNGTAVDILIAGGVAGIAQISASTTDGGPPTIMSFEFVGSRAELNSAREYVEIVAPGYMQFANDKRIIGAAAPNKGVSLRYREIEIQASDLQYDINEFVVRARKATIHIGRMVKDFDEVMINLKERHGFGITNYMAPNPDAVAIQGLGLVFLRQKDSGGYEIPPDQPQYGMVEISRDSVRQSNTLTTSSTFEFADLSTSPSTISARKAVVFPKRKIQFQGAEIYVANAKVIKLPLFVVNLQTSTSPLVTDDLLSVNNSQLGLNYPQYLSLKPGFTSLLRFHMGDQYSAGEASDRGAFLDYELNWDRGDDMEGGLTLGGLLRDDWSVSARQYWRFDDSTSANLSFGMPANSSILGSGSISHEFKGYSANVDASSSQTISGFASSSQTGSLNLLSDPQKVWKLPAHIYYGLTATDTQNYNQFIGHQVQAGEGLTTRIQTDSLPIDKISSWTASVTANKLYGTNEEPGIALLGVVNLSHRLSKNANILLTYNYTQDRLNDVVLGRNMFTLQGNYAAGPFSFNLTSSRSLGVERTSMFGSASYRLSHLWHLSYLYTSNRYLSDEYLDYNFILGYKIGWREVGLTWSKSTQRIGFELLGASF